VASRGQQQRRRFRRRKAPVQALIEHDLVDEYRLMVFPVILGSGRRLFPDDAADKAILKLVDSKVFDSGVAVCTYHPARDE
jgi:dihydrofolate reductase